MILIPSFCFFVCSCPSAVPGGTTRSRRVPRVQTGSAERVPASGRPQTGTGSLTHQDRREQDAQNLRLPHQRRLH